MERITTPAELQKEGKHEIARKLHHITMTSPSMHLPTVEERGTKYIAREKEYKKWALGRENNWITESSINEDTEENLDIKVDDTVTLKELTLRIPQLKEEMQRIQKSNPEYSEKLSKVIGAIVEINLFFLK